MENINDTASAVAAAVTGPDTPDSVRVKRPTKESVWMLLTAMAMASVVGITLTVMIALRPWPESVAKDRIMWLGIALIMAQVSIPITIIALASSRLGKVEATAGNNSFTLDGRNDS